MAETGHTDTQPASTQCMQCFLVKAKPFSGRSLTSALPCCQALMMFTVLPERSLAASHTGVSPSVSGGRPLTSLHFTMQALQPMHSEES
jgi:hypothetical protein